MHVFNATRTYYMDVSSRKLHDANNMHMRMPILMKNALKWFSGGCSTIILKIPSPWSKRRIRTPNGSQRKHNGLGIK